MLAPILLNSGDSITVKMLVSQFDREVSIDGRIAGVKAKASQGRVSAVLHFDDGRNGLDMG